MNPILKKNTNLISKLCETHNVKELYVFGSVLTSNFNNESDIDLIVSFFPQNALEYADNYYELKFALEEILKIKIDLLEEKAIKNPYFREVVDQNKQLIYGHAN